MGTQALDFSDLGGKRVGSAQQPSTWQVLTQPTEKTDKEYLGYTGPAGVAGATIKGLDDVARSTKGAISGTWGAVRHPVDTATSVAQLPAQAAQVPAVIHDINQAPDSTERYLQAAQDTASQGAGQALTALGSAGAGSVAKAVAPYAWPVTKALVTGYAKKLIPDEVGEAMKAVKATKAAAAAPPQAPPEVTSPSRTLPGQNPPEIIQPPPQNTAAPIPPRSSLALPPAPIGAELSELPATGAKSAAQTGEALGTIKRGSIADSMRQPAATPATPWLKPGTLQNLLQDSLGGKPLDPKVPLRQQMPTATPTPTPAPAPTPTSAPPATLTAEPEHIGQFARANGLELHQAIPESVQGDVLRAKIHDLTNVQVRQLAINAGEDMGQQAVTNAKNAGGVTRQAVLSRILAQHTPEEIGQMIDQGQHLPPGAQRGSIATSWAGRNGR